MKRSVPAFVLLLAFAACSSSGGSSTPTTSPTSTATASAQSYTCPTATTSSGTLNCTVLTLGDNKYSTTAPAVGTVYACSVPNGSGATGTPPWINSASSTWNALTKVVVSGSVAWSGTFSASTSGSAINVAGNGLPLSPITTGTYPIATTDPAYAYDQNPNHIAAQSISYALPYPPVAAASPACVPMGRIGMALNGVSFYNALDAAGHDAGAHEEQDACHGHPDQSSTYHYHGWLQVCVTDAGSATQNSSLIGYALDGYGIYGPWYNGKVLMTSDLDVCHGTTSVVMWQGAQTNIYHYVSTYDYPYTVSCFHGTAVHQ